MKKNILFLCTGNSCRSQMAEGWGKKLKGEKFNFFSAGTKKHGLNPLAVKVMQEENVDISMHTSNTTDELSDVKFDYVITVCKHAHETCPYFHQGQVLHQGFDDPPFLTQDMKDEANKLKIYRRVRDEIKDFISKIEKFLEE